MKETETLRQHRIDLDKISAQVMPESWEGHARLLIRESDAIAPSVEQSAIRKVAKLAEDKSGITPEKVARALIQKVEESNKE